MAGTIIISDIKYGPNPFFLETGGRMYFKFTVGFDSTPPSQFVYEVDLIDRNGTTVRTLSATKDNPLQTGNAVALYWDGKDESGNAVPMNGGYGPTFRVTVPASKEAASKDLSVTYNTKSMISCSGPQLGNSGGGQPPGNPPSGSGGGQPPGKPPGPGGGQPPSKPPKKEPPFEEGYCPPSNAPIYK